ncbi:MAG: outer-membrane lipoprotein carrier protein LolA [Muribaculaceae bacterium]|nr:outer-membrane lipoprotein carrier protein LolA [Muribaculaceae bacterium]
MKTEKKIIYNLFHIDGRNAERVNTGNANVGKMMVLRWLSIMLLTVISWGGLQAQTPTASEVVSKAAAKLGAATGLKVTFTLTSGGRNLEGTLVESGNRFAVTTAAGSTWYNGQSMWSYNPRTNETTLSTPDAEELRVANPLYYLQDAGNQKAYTIKYVKQQPTGKYAVALLPMDKKSNLRSVIAVIDRNYDIKEIKVTTTSGQETTLTVRGLDLKSRQAASQFEYPRIKYPKVPVIDMR